MLIIVPSSETKRPEAEAGPPVDLAALSFPELTPMRERVLEALIETSAGPDAFRRLHVSPVMAGEVARNTRLRELPASPVAEVYAGPLHQGLGIATLSPPARQRAEAAIVVTSALWGLLRLPDRVPPYRVYLYAWLVGLERLDAEWRNVLPAIVSTAAGPAGLVLDLRSPQNQMIGKPPGLGHRTVSLRVRQSQHGHRIGDVIAKRVRGQAARHLLDVGENPGDPDALAEILADRWPTRLEEPHAADQPWRLTLLTSD